MSLTLLAIEALGIRGLGPGVNSTAEIPVHDAEGEVIGRLAWRRRGNSV
ncbi:MAG: hypothetical protein V4739_15510 [Pseudomonadota bacterium]